jgi:hypothetical protein
VCGQRGGLEFSVALPGQKFWEKLASRDGIFIGLRRSRDRGHRFFIADFCGEILLAAAPGGEVEVTNFFSSVII